ncbi:MAG: hypothetical protein EYC71_04130 [Gammaproteobacteria bacterium]|nr:MAG: hypothetical protein EYC71_04130 [Gammaproteobacteria bacterium]
MNTKMKTLSMAVLGLVGFTAAGAAMAQCPASLSPPWSLVSTLQGTATSQTGGYDSTACRLRVALNQNSSPAAKAFVLDQTPANEQRYRVQFIVDASGIGLTQANRAATAFSIVGTTAVPNGNSNIVRAFLRGDGAGAALRFLVGDTADPSQYRTLDVALPNQAGANRVELDLTIGAAASMKYWINNISTATTEGSPTGTLSGLANSGWGGVDQASLGLVGATSFWRANFTNTSFVYFDQFDSRRQTFIGN